MGPSLAPCRATQVSLGTRFGMWSLLEDTLQLAAFTVIIIIITMIQNVLIAVSYIVWRTLELHKERKQFCFKSQLSTLLDSA